MNYELDDHNSADYDRKACAYRCGNGSRWRKPCWQGPEANGKCGGESECIPLRRGDRYYCQRPNHAGGPCQEGPLSHGGCSHNRKPCQPVPTVRKHRGRIAILGVLFLIALMAVFADRKPGSVMTAMINPGELSSTHSGFPVSDRCENCHAPHDESAADWFLSAFKHEDLTPNCVQCHKMPGPNQAPHNRIFGNEKDERIVECKSCHQEHKGAEFDISRVSDQMCSNCHEQRFDSFSRHVAFSDNYPHQEPQNIFFDHSTHLGEYFVEESWLEKEDRDAEFAVRARNACSSCHQIENAGRDIQIRDYEAICANCHDQQIAQRSMTLFTPDEVYPALLGLITPADEEAPDTYDAALALIETISSDGIDGLYEVLAEAGSDLETQQRLFNGLNPVALRETARLWSEEESVEAESELSDRITGWTTGENDDGAEAVLYKASGHADATLKLWIEMYLDKQSEDQSDHVVDAVASLMDASTGAGACAKCHASVSGSFMREEQFKWGKSAITVRAHTSGFSHVPHIDLIGKTEGCEACHVSSKTADYPAYFDQGGMDIEMYQSSFDSIKMDTCSTCHNEKRVSADCQSCHSYHSDLGFQVEHQKREKERMKP